MSVSIQISGRSCPHVRSPILVGVDGSMKHDYAAVVGVGPVSTIVSNSPFIGSGNPLRLSLWILRRRSKRFSVRCASSTA